MAVDIRDPVKKMCRITIDELQHYLNLHQLLVNLPPAVRYFVITSHLIIAVRTWDDIMTGIFLPVFRTTNNLHPPAVSFAALDKNDAIFKICCRNNITDKIIAVRGRKVHFAVIVTFKNIPNHLSEQMRCNSVPVKQGLSSKIRLTKVYHSWQHSGQSGKLRRPKIH